MGDRGSMSKNQGGFGIFDKIYNYLNRQNKEEKEQQERKQREESRLLQGGSMGLLSKQNFQYNTMSPAQRSDEFIKKYQNYQKMDEIQKLNMPFQPSYNRFGTGQRPLPNPRFAQNQMVLSTKTEEILQRSQMKMMPRTMMSPSPMTAAAQQNNAASEIPLSANLKEIKESMNQNQKSESESNNQN